MGLRLITSGGETLESSPTPERSPQQEASERKGYIATYNVSPQAPGPHDRGFEVENLTGLLQGFVDELKRVKDKGVVVSATYNAETAVITVEAPNGL